MAGRSLFVAGLQTAGVPADPAATLERFEERVRSLRGLFDGLELVVAPELHLMAIPPLLEKEAPPESLAVDVPGELTGRLGAPAHETGLWLVPGSGGRRGPDRRRPGRRGRPDRPCLLPPGHHVTRAAYGGSCSLSNAAVAAESLRRRLGGPIAVVDIDAHHGDGTQELFRDCSEVRTASVHVDPAAGWFPRFLGSLGVDAEGGYDLAAIGLLVAETLAGLESSR